MKKILVSVCVVCLTSCDHYYDYEYMVENLSDSTIIVELYAENDPVLDTIYQIPTGQSLLIYECTHGNEGSDGPFFDEVSKDLTELTVKINDTLLSNRNYLENENWTFVEGLYSTTVTNKEFD